MSEPKIPKTFFFESYARDHQATLTEGQIVKRTGTYRHPKPEPQVENYCPSCGGLCAGHRMEGRRMKHTEKRWMHLESGRIRKSGFDPCKELVDNYLLVTVTWDEPEYEDVEVVRMYCPECQTVMTKKEHEQNNCCKNAVELRGTYRRRKPEPQVWEGEIIGQFWLPAEFEGKKVRIEVIP